MNDEQSIRKGVMDAIHEGKVNMRPRWYFALLSVLAFLGALILFLTALYVVSLALFFLHDSGAWFALSFGTRGWWDFLQAVPWALVLLAVLFIVVLEVLVRRTTFVYQRPLLASVASILLLVMLGAFALSQTPLHHQLNTFARQGQLPPPIGFWYGDTLRSREPDELYRGTIAEIDAGGFTLLDPDRPATTTIVLTPRTRLPLGSDFSVGEKVIVIGDRVASDTVEAYGVRDIDN